MLLTPTVCSLSDSPNRPHAHPPPFVPYDCLFPCSSDMFSARASCRPPVALSPPAGIHSLLQTHPFWPVQKLETLPSAMLPRPVQSPYEAEAGRRLCRGHIPLSGQRGVTPDSSKFQRHQCPDHYRPPALFPDLEMRLLCRGNLNQIASASRDAEARHHGDAMFFQIYEAPHFWSCLVLVKECTIWGTS